MVTRLSNYPSGFPNGVSIRNMPIALTHPGNVWWVDSNASSAGPRGTAQRPFVTLANALAHAASGDIIMLKPGHAETLSSATALALAVAGVAIIGLGTGALRPTFTLDTAATATIGVAAASVTFKNCRFVPNYADITAVFTLAAAPYFSLEDCFIGGGAANMNFLNVVDTNATTNDARGLNLSGNVWIEPDTATLGFVKMNGTNDDMVFDDNYLSLGVKNNTASVMAIATGKVVTNLRMRRNGVFRLNTDTATGALLITTDGSTNSGIIANNYGQHADTAAEVMVTASSGFGFFENRFSGVAGATGYVLPAVDS